MSHEVRRRPTAGGHHRPRRALAALVLVGGVLVGCGTGERPRLADTDVFAPGPPTGDPAIDAVLTILERGPAGPMQASYRIQRRIGGVTNQADVSIDAAGGRTIRIGTVTFERMADGVRTCVEGTGAAPSCSPGVNQARISDTGVTMEFWSRDAAKRLRRNAVSKIGPATGATTTIAGQPATCVDVPLGAQAATYCAAAAGVVAKIVEGDVLVDAVTITTGTGTGTATATGS